MLSRIRNCAFLVANVTENFALATRILQLVTSGRLTSLGDNYINNNFNFQPKFIVALPLVTYLLPFCCFWSIKAIFLLLSFYHNVSQLRSVGSFTAMFLQRFSITFHLLVFCCVGNILLTLFGHRIFAYDDWKKNSVAIWHLFKKVNFGPCLKKLILDPAIKQLRNGKAVGPDNIPAEALKVDIMTNVELLYPLFNNIWEEKQVPTEWKEGYLIKLTKKVILAPASITEL